MTVSRFPDMPKRIAALPVSAKGFPTPYFVYKPEDGSEPDFRVTSQRAFNEAVSKRLCWICGQTLGRHMAMVVGPMCCINGISAEPPSHLDCALFAAKHCPFLATPLARRNKRNLPEKRHVPGVMIERNPGVVCIWMIRSYSLMKATGGVLVTFGDPEEMYFFKEGREATRAEIDESVMSGFPRLLEVSEAEGPAAVRELHVQFGHFISLLDRAYPAAAA
jgi:hypothetical protein